MTFSPPSRRKGKEVAKTQNWVDYLPHDVTVAILLKVGTYDILENIQKVCVSWRKICRDPALWRSINMNIIARPSRLVWMTKQAIDRSRGQLIDLNLEHFGNDHLLNYLTNRKNQLRRLRMVNCPDITDEGLSEAAKKMPSMEELHIYYGSITDEGLENVGHSCPGLKSLTYNEQGQIPVLESDEEDEAEGFYPNSDAFAISRSMPELRHLSMFGNQMSSRGLKAILDGCPHLESLDLRQCYRLSMFDEDGESFGELGKRCSSIKVFRNPYDSTDDYEFDTTVYRECNSESESDSESGSYSESESGSYSESESGSYSESDSYSDSDSNDDDSNGNVESDD